MGSGASSAVLAAARGGHVQQLKELLDKGFPVNEAIDGYGMTALHMAARFSSACVALLLDRGANVDKADNLGYTALHGAAKERKGGDSLALLLNHGANVNKADTFGNTALTKAAEAGIRDNIAMLLDHGADIDKANDLGQTALHLAASGPLSELGKPCFFLLLERGANANKADKKGKTPLDLASWKWNATLINEAMEKHRRDAATKQQEATSSTSPAMAARQRQQVAPASATYEAATVAAAAAASKNRQQETTAASSTHKPVFLSFRVKEARTQAIALKAALEARGWGTFCSEVDIPKGQDWITTITVALDACTLFVVLATKEYGAKGTDAFGTPEELAFAKKEGKDLYIVRMAERMDNPTARVLLGTVQQGAEWEGPANRVPQRIVDDICAMLQ